MYHSHIRGECFISQLPFSLLEHTLAIVILALRH